MRFILGTTRREDFCHKEVSHKEAQETQEAQEGKGNEEYLGMKSSYLKSGYLGHEQQLLGA